MSLKKNLPASYVSQIYVAIIGIILVPVYIMYMGAEAYGLVGFFVMLQAWFSLLDVGLSGTLARESARLAGGAINASQFRSLLRALEGIFLVIGLAGGLFFYFGSGYISTKWLKATTIPLSEVKTSIEIMAVIITVRWMGGIYRSVVTGAEKLVWLGGYTSIMATFRFVGVLPILIFINASPKTFFTYQAFIALIEIVGLVAYTYQIIPKQNIEERISWSLEPIKPLLRFSMTLATTSIIWILTTQTDKLMLSTLLPLTDYGYFTLAVLVASGVTLVSAPVSVALMSRMARLEAEREHASLITVYRRTTQLVAVIAGATSLTLALYAEPILWAWTGDLALAKRAAPVLVLYALGNGVLSVSAFPYYLQYAKGDLRLHLIGNIIFVTLLIPTLIAVTSNYGMIGAGYVWLTVNCLTFFIWLPFIHRKFSPGLNKDWYLTDVLRIFLCIGLFGLALNSINIEINNRFFQFLAVGGMGFLLMVIGALSSTAFWELIKKRSHSV